MEPSKGRESFGKLPLAMAGIKTVPRGLSSYPFVERLAGDLRRECLDRALFWKTADLQNKLLDFEVHPKHHPTRAAREGRPPDDESTQPVADLQSYRSGYTPAQG